MLCSLTYAWFTSETSSSSNTLKSGSFDLDVKIEKIENNETTDVTDNLTKQNDVWSGTLDAGEYRVTLTRAVGSTSNGYCFVKIGNGEEQPTVVIADTNAEDAVDTNPLTFTIKAASATDIELTPRWGIPKTPLITNGGSAPAVVETTNAGE